MNILSIGIDSKHTKGFIERLNANPLLKLYDGLFIAEDEFKQNSKLFKNLGKELDLKPIVLYSDDFDSNYETARQHLFLHPKDIATQCNNGIYVNSVDRAPITSVDSIFSINERDIEYVEGRGILNRSIINNLLNYTRHHLSEDFVEHYEESFEDFIKDKDNSDFSEYVKLREIFYFKEAKDMLTNPEFYITK